LQNLQIGDITQPVVFTNERGDKGVRILYLKSRSEPHRMNLKDDYDRISQMAVEEKKYGVLDRWMNKHIPAFYVMLDQEAATCGQLQKWVSAATAANLKTSKGY
jgi:peptidyl-prolyl cis-trans isomerase SurA